MLKIYPYMPQRLANTKKENKDARNVALEVLRTCQNKYGRPSSSTYLLLKAQQHSQNEKYADVVEKMRKKAPVIDQEINPNPEYYYARANKSPRLIDYGKDFRQGHLVGNCGECASVVQTEFADKGIRTVNVTFSYNNKENGIFCNHAFTLSNIPKGITMENPNTWGDEAIITDLWSGISMKKKDAFEYYEKEFGIPNLRKATFKLMPDSQSLLQAHCREYFDIKPPDSRNEHW